MTFVHKFKSGCCCTVIVNDEPPAPGTRHIQAYEWEGHPDPSIIDEYKQWIHSIQSQLATYWDTNIVHVFLLPNNELETWHYAPGKMPELAA